jgi:hypothetical protein
MTFMCNPARTGCSAGNLKTVFWRHLGAALSIASLCLALSSCLAPPKREYLPDGQLSGLTSAGMAQRSGLNPSPVPITLPVYHPINCEFEERTSSAGGAVARSPTTIAILPIVPDKLFVHKIGGSGEGTMLMDRSGKELDLNMLTVDGSSDLTPEMADAIAKQKMSAIGRRKNPHMLVQFLELPHFTATAARPGDRVADVTVERGALWGVYVYRGTVQFKGTRGELFDIVHVQLGAWAVRGFVVLDPGHAVPLLTDFNFGDGKARELELKSCAASS